MKVKRHERIIAAIVRPFMLLFLKLKFNLHITRFTPREGSSPPYLILCNHNTDYDPIFLGMCFPFFIRYVASDHIMRYGFLSRLLKLLVSPIPKLKSVNDTRTVRDIISTLRSNVSVCIFPEGNRSWNGETEDISPAIGKLAKHMRVPLTLCRISGAYLSSPRWADKTRKGRIDCRAVRELTCAEIDAMDADALNTLIRNELYVNAMADKKVNPVAYKGKNLAQSIETVLFTCPRCRRFATISSKNDTAQCGCGLRFTYDKHGLLHSAPFRTILEWDRWQRAHLHSIAHELFATDSVTPILSDSSQRLYRIERARKTELVEEGAFLLYNNRFVFKGAGGSREFLIRDIHSLTVIGRLVLQFSTVNGAVYEVRSKIIRSAYKYKQFFEAIREIGILNNHNDGGNTPEKTFTPE